MKVTEFRRYPFTVGEKIFIADGPRKGDWEVVRVDDKKVGLRCPVTGIEVSWTRFCYCVAKADRDWPSG
jgi:hypothetical protein